MGGKGRHLRDTEAAGGYSPRSAAAAEARDSRLLTKALTPEMCDADRCNIDLQKKEGYTPIYIAALEILRCLPKPAYADAGISEAGIV